MHPVIQKMTEVINLSDELLRLAQTDEWLGFDEKLQQRQALLVQVKAEGVIESLVTEGFGELAVQLIQEISSKNEEIHHLATHKREALTTEIRQFTKGDKAKSAYK